MVRGGESRCPPCFPAGSVGLWFFGGCFVFDFQQWNCSVWIRYRIQHCCWITVYRYIDRYINYCLVCLGGHKVRGRYRYVRCYTYIDTQYMYGLFMVLLILREGPEGPYR